MHRKKALTFLSQTKKPHKREGTYFPELGNLKQPLKLKREREREECRFSTEHVSLLTEWVCPLRE
jgi:hypothetical protein